MRQGEYISLIKRMVQNESTYDEGFINTIKE